MIPIYKWTQVHAAIQFSQFISHEAVNNPLAFIAVNARFKEIYGREMSFHTADTLVTLCWMVLARSYELVDKGLKGDEKTKFYIALRREADSHCQCKCFADIKKKYLLSIIEFPDEGVQFETSLWKFVKVLRDSISHVDYSFNFSKGKTAGNVLINIYHDYSGKVRLNMSAPFDKFFLLTEHIGVWIDSALQNHGLLRR